MSLLERWVATRAGFKPRDVEEVIDFYWRRPLAGLLVDTIKNRSITPNQVTGLSALASLVAGIVIGLSGLYQHWWCAIGGLLLFVSIVLDCADGQLARVRGTFSELGRALDGLADAVAPTSVLTGMVVYLLLVGFPHAWVWPVGWAAAFSLIWHASSYDLFKNIYLHASRPDFTLGGDMLISSDTMREKLAKLRADGKRFDAFIMLAWVVWSKPQSKQMDPWIGSERTPQNEQERQQYLSLLKPVMRAATWLGFGTHLFILTVAAMLAPLDPFAIWIAWGIMIGPLNLLGLYVAIMRSRRERQYFAALKELRG